MIHQTYLDSHVEQEGVHSVKQLCRSIVQKIEFIDDHQDNVHEEIHQNQAVGMAVFIYMRENEKNLKEKYPSIDQDQIMRNLFRKWKKLPQVEKDKYIYKVNCQNLYRKSKKKRKQEKRREKEDDLIDKLKEQTSLQDKQQPNLEYKEEITIQSSQASQSSLENKYKQIRINQFVIKNTELQGAQNKSILIFQPEQRNQSKDFIKQEGRFEQVECQLNIKIDLNITQVQKQQNFERKPDFM